MGISKTLRRFLKEKVESGSDGNLFVAIFYNFTRETGVDQLFPRTTEFLYDKEKIHIGLDKGILKFPWIHKETFEYMMKLSWWLVDQVLQLKSYSVLCFLDLQLEELQD